MATRTEGPPPLYPTRTRLDLLRQVADGMVYEPRWSLGTVRTVAGDVVTARIKEMCRAGWVVLAPATRDVAIRARQVMTAPVGRQVLADAAAPAGGQ